jgi:hypothetical protein
MRGFWRQSGASALIAFALAGILTAAAPARASIAVLVEEPYGHLGGMDPAGHSAVYFDHICAATPLTLRPCREGEMGAVISRYDGIDKYDWLAMPLVAYLYAVDSPSDIPSNVDKTQVEQLRDNYRRKHLLDIAPDNEDGSAPKGNWYELVGSAYDRTSYGFQVKTTAEQDAGLIAMFNDRKNVELYNGAFRNCADFARVTINRFYPHAVRRNFVADLGLTSPKQVAHALTKYGTKHPEAELSVFKIVQVTGSLPRSRPPKGLMESLVKSKRYVVPITAVEPVATAAILVAYLGGGRFAMPKNAPVLSMEPAVDAEATGAGAPTPPADVKTAPGSPAVLLERKP